DLRLSLLRRCNACRRDRHASSTDSRTAMIRSLQFSRHTTASAPQLPALRESYCCQMPCRPISPPVAGMLVAPTTATRVDLCVADRSLLRSLAILRTTAKVKYP